MIVTAKMSARGEDLMKDFAPLTARAKQAILPGFIVLEGLDGSGTSTQLSRLGEALRTQQIVHWTTCEPTDGPIGREIRSILRGEQPMQSKDQLAVLFSQDRAAHLEEIKARTKAGEVVISDRYLFSSVAYQSTEVGAEKAYELNKNFLLPEHCFFLDIDAETSESRRSSRAMRERYENFDEQYELRMRYHASLSAFENSEMQLHILDGLLPIDTITEQILSTILSSKIHKE